MAKARRKRKPPMDFRAAHSDRFLGKAKCVQGSAPAHLATLHQTQGPTAENGAITLTTRTDGSAHVCLDWDICYRIADDDAILCGVGGANSGNWHLEMAGSSLWERATWFRKKHRRMLKFAAWEMARFLDRNGLTLRYYSITDLNRAGSLPKVRGWSTHNNLSRSMLSDSTHTDPGRMFPMKWWKRYLRFYFEHPGVHVAVDLNRKGLRRG